MSMSTTQMLNSIQTLRSNGITVNNLHLTKAIHKLNYVWMIENYSFHHAKKSVLKTPLFTADTSRACKWFLTLRHDPKFEDNTMGVFINLHKSSECKTAFIKFKFCILDDEFKENKVMKGEDVHQMTAGVEDWGFGKFISKNQHLNKKLLLNDILTIHCEITFSEIEDFLETAVDSDLNSIEPATCPEYCISKDFYALFENQKLTDFTLSVKGKEYRVHKAVLAARSPVFGAMFEHNMKENQNNLVEITDIEEKVVEGMLHYIYTDECKNLKDLATGLLVASDKYDLMGLKIVCQEFLINDLKVENAAETLYLAELHAASKLKSMSISFIAAHSNQVMNSAGWEKCSPVYPPLLMKELCEVISRHASSSFN